MLPITICRHWQVEWLSADECLCEQCGKVGVWFDGMVLWQRRRSSAVPTQGTEASERGSWPVYRRHAAGARAHGALAEGRELVHGETERAGAA